MASPNAIAATTSAIVGLLDEGYPRAFGKLDVRAVHASDVAGDTAIPDGFTVCLYRIALNGSLRNAPPRARPDGSGHRTSLPVDLHYVITPWAGHVEKQQRLLGWGMRHLEDNAILPAGMLNRYLTESNVFRPEEAVELVCESLSLTDFTSIWYMFKPRLQTSAMYVARMVVIDSDIDLPARPKPTR